MNQNNEKLTTELQNAISQFSRKESQTQIFTPTVDGKKYFIKVSGKDRGKYKDNEIETLEFLSKKSPFYSDYFITSMTKDNKSAILLKYVEGTDMYEMIHSKEKWSQEFLIKLYKILLAKVRFYHNNLLTHGDIKATNFYIHTDKNDKVDIDLIDTESVNNFNKEYRKKNQNFINFISVNYDFPVKLKRGNIHFYSHKNAFLFYKYLDIYSTSILIFYLYKPHVYQMLKKRGDHENPWKIGKKQKSPIEYIKKQSNPLEKALYYVFSFLPYVEKEGKMIRIENIPISHTQIISILDEKDEKNENNKID